MISCNKVSFSYGSQAVIKGISFELDSATMVALLGVNGSGKSTLLKILSRLLSPQQGTIFINNMPLGDFAESELSKLIAYMPQKSNGAYCSVFDAVLLGRKPRIGLEASRHDIEFTSEILRQLGLTGYAFRNTVELSGGELQKVIIARALAQEPKILLLDEPINHLDIKNQLEIMTTLKTITVDMHLTTVIVMHDLSMAMRFADKFLVLKDGELYAYGDSSVITSQTIKDVYGIDAVVQTIGGVSVVVPKI